MTSSSFPFDLCDTIRFPVRVSNNCRIPLVSMDTDTDSDVDIDDDDDVDTMVADCSTTFVDECTDGDDTTTNFVLYNLDPSNRFIPRNVRL